MSVVHKALKKLKSSSDKEKDMRFAEESLASKGLLPKRKFSHFGDKYQNK